MEEKEQVEPRRRGWARAWGGGRGASSVLEGRALLRQLLRQILREDAEPQPLLICAPRAGHQRQRARERAQERRLARAVGAAHHEPHPAAQLQADALQNVLAALRVAERRALELEQQLVARRRLCRMEPRARERQAGAVSCRPGGSAPERRTAASCSLGWWRCPPTSCLAASSCASTFSSLPCRSLACFAFDALAPIRSMNACRHAAPGSGQRPGRGRARSGEVTRLQPRRLALLRLHRAHCARLPLRPLGEELLVRHRLVQLHAAARDLGDGVGRRRDELLVV